MENAEIPAEFALEAGTRMTMCLVTLLASKGIITFQEYGEEIAAFVNHPDEQDSLHPKTASLLKAAAKAYCGK